MGSLTTKAKIALGFVLTLILGAGVGVGVYFAVRGSSNAGPEKFGTLEVLDKTTNRVQSSFESGETVRLKFTAPNGHDTPVRYEIQVAAGQSFIPIGQEQHANIFDYQLPLDTFSTTVKFRVVDELAPTDFVDSAPVSVTPVFRVTEGPGLRRDQAITRKESLAYTLELDPKIPALSVESDFAVDLATSATFADAEPATLASFAPTTSVLTWSTDTEKSSVFCRVRTTSLKAKGEPEELMFAAPFPVAVNAAIMCSPTDPDLCAVYVTNTSGAEGKFTPDEKVLLNVKFATATYPDNVTLSDTTDGTTFAPLTTVSGPTIKESTAVYEYFLGSTETDKYQVRATNGPNSITSPVYSIVGNFTVDSPTTYALWPSSAPRDNLVQSKVQAQPNFLGYNSITDWEVGYYDPSTSAFTLVRKVSSGSFAGDTATVTWYFTQEDLASVLVGRNSVELELAMKITGTAGSLNIRAATLTLFEKGDFLPDASPVSVLGGARFWDTLAFGDVGLLEVKEKSTPSLPSWWLRSDTFPSDICLFRGPEQPPYNLDCLHSIQSLGIAGFGATLDTDMSPIMTFEVQGDSANFTLTSTGNSFENAQVCLASQSGTTLVAVYDDAQTCAEAGEPRFQGSWAVLPSA